LSRAEIAQSVLVVECLNIGSLSSVRLASALVRYLISSEGGTSNASISPENADGVLALGTASTDGSTWWELRYGS
jgi:hypothetical protein